MDKVCLLNILMQLWKVRNHSYLFDGVKPGKMMLLHKFIKLRYAYVFTIVIQYLINLLF